MRTWSEMSPAERLASLDRVQVEELAETRTVSNCDALSASDREHVGEDSFK